MYVRVTTFKIDPRRLAELAETVKEMRRLTKALPGLQDAYVSWREDGQGAVISIYESKARAEAAAGRIQAIWGAVAGLVTSVPRVDIYDTVEKIA
jgi:quinol monooxygenase YgiN